MAERYLASYEIQKSSTGSNFYYPQTAAVNRYVSSMPEYMYRERYVYDAVRGWVRLCMSIPSIYGGVIRC